MSTRDQPGMLEGPLTHSVSGAFYEVQGQLGFGFREYIYALALERELVAKGHRVEREVAVMVHYRGVPLAWQTLDMIVDGRLVIVFKATELLHPSATQQLFGYLCATNLEVGLLLHFGREAKFYRVICENRLKRRQQSDRRSDNPITAPTPDPLLP